MEGIRTPIPERLGRALRRAVLDHRTTERRSTFAPRLQVGWPGGPVEVLACGPPGSTDHALRTDIVAALLARAVRQHRADRLPGEPIVWLTRPGGFEPQDADMDWLAAARSAAGEAQLPLTMVVVTRQGWRDPRSGERRTWVRLRERSGVG